MSAADRNKIIIAGGIALIAIILIVFFLRSRGGKQAATTAGGGGFGGTAQTAAGGAPQAGGAAAPGQAAPAAPGGRAGAAAGAGGAAATGPAAPGAVQIAQAPSSGAPYLGVVRMGTGASEPSRIDPFLTFEAPPAPIPPEVSAALPPVVLQTGGLRPGGLPENVGGPLGQRRVAGLLFDDGAWAILEQDNQTFIVKPGDIVDGNRITAIGPDSIFVTDNQGRRWRVDLRALAPQGGSTAPSSVPGMPEAPPTDLQN
jgi:hypothetical protein